MLSHRLLGLAKSPYESSKELTKHDVVAYENCYDDYEWLLKATKAFKLIEDTREILQSGLVCWAREENDDEAAMY